MPTVHSFTVLPALPDPLKGLESIAKNMFWSWNPDFIELFKRIDSNLWIACVHNPIKLLGSVSQAKLDASLKIRASSANCSGHLRSSNITLRGRPGLKGSVLNTPTLLLHTSVPSLGFTNVCLFMPAGWAYCQETT